MNQADLAMSKSKKIKQVSIKQKAINSSLVKVKNDVLEGGKDVYGVVRCAGCHRTDKGVDRSHILSVAQRPDLQLDPRNIELLCRDCHTRWESGNIESMTQLLCFHHSMRYIFDMDMSRFNKILNKAFDGWQYHSRVKYNYDLLSEYEDWFCNKFENGSERCLRQCGKCANI